MILTIVGDESHDETEERTFAVAAVMPPDDICVASESWWLEVTAGQTFHAAEFERSFANDR